MDEEAQGRIETKLDAVAKDLGELVRSVDRLTSRDEILELQLGHVSKALTEHAHSPESHSGVVKTADELRKIIYAGIGLVLTIVLVAVLGVVITQ